MNREIKFKLLDINENNLYPSFGFKDFSAGNFGEIFIESKYLHDISDGQIDNYRLLQYTGVKDMNGVEIYEGDIIQSSDLRIAEICWGHKTARFKAIKINMNHDSNDIIGILLWDECKIIGNIFENPELLESE
ncbi:MAG: YopX family protein [Chitinophagales bacterium]